MNKKILKIVLIMFVILIVFSSLMRIYSAIDLSNIPKGDPEDIRIEQINNNLDKVHTILLVIQVLISIVHIIKSKKNRKVLVLICSCFMLNFSEIFTFVTKHSGGGLFADDSLYVARSALTLNKLVISLNILMIGIHIFFIIKNSKTDKDICQNNKNEGRIDIN